jgi:alkanesulfonate monooxygenase SsuD/methylene tetrahydromethanopterin reductase-like flavin-dependent oxidoreductase (luciferase family)
MCRAVWPAFDLVLHACDSAPAAFWRGSAADPTADDDEEISMPGPTVSQAARMAMHGQNALTIGLFGANCSSGRAVTLVPERWSGGWDDNLALARLADETGIDFMLPIGRWKGYGGDTDYQGATYETVTWASGLLASTRRITVFGTVHAPLFNPIIAAKMMVTADHIGRGRFGLNIVCGWNEDEFQMFGVTQRDHERRYQFAQEWWDAVQLAWSDKEDFGYQGEFLKLEGIRAKPKPYGGSRPVVMNAGASANGRAFAIRNCDAFFTRASRTSLGETADRVSGFKAEAKSLGRDMDVYTVGVVTCRKTAQEARDYYRHAVVEHADWSAVDLILKKKNISVETVGEAQFKAQREQYANGMGGYPLVGDADQVAGELAQLSKAGLRGLAISMVNYLEELPFFAGEVIPRLRRMGLRA